MFEVLKFFIDDVHLTSRTLIELWTRNEVIFVMDPNVSYIYVKKTHIFHGVLDSEAPLADEGLALVDKILRNVDGEGEASESQEGCQVSGVKAGQNRDEDPPSSEGHANRVCTRRQNRSLFH